MPNIRKSDDVKYNQIIANMNIGMIGELDTIALDNKISRNEVIRIFCNYGLKNRKKFNLK